jgi:hypothetical protein
MLDKYKRLMGIKRVVVFDATGNKGHWDEREMWVHPSEARTVTTTDKLFFLLEAQLFHGCTRKEALMLWNDGIDTLYDSVSTQTTHTN